MIIYLPAYQVNKLDNKKSSGEEKVKLTRESSQHLTTISIVYDFNNLGASTLATLDTFSVVKRTAKSVFMGKKWSDNSISLFFVSSRSLFSLSMKTTWKGSTPSLL